MTESQKLRVLVVDDEEVIASTLAMILRINGFAPEFFTNPNDALKTARLNAPNLLISDVVMPQMSGIELAIKVMEICPQCKVLLFSGQAVTVDLLQTDRVSGYKFQVLQKPIHPTDLLAAVRTVAEASVRASSDNDRVGPPGGADH